MTDAQNPPTLPIKRVVAIITRLTIASLFIAIIGTVAIFVGCAEGGGTCQDGQPLPGWIATVTKVTGGFWGLVMLLLLILPVPLFMSMRAQRRQQAALDQADT
ncbi:MAG: hypothetical protein KI792_09395 [Alphaproteobacteria bacterium]|nr:hypothetical protein [Alphaproteobacteria bacterium SS10]